MVRRWSYCIVWWHHPGDSRVSLLRNIEDRNLLLSLLLAMTTLAVIISLTVLPLSSSPVLPWCQCDVGHHGVWAGQRAGCHQQHPEVRPQTSSTLFYLPAAEAHFLNAKQLQPTAADSNQVKHLLTPDWQLLEVSQSSTLTFSAALPGGKCESQRIWIYLFNENQGLF